MQRDPEQATGAFYGSKREFMRDCHIMYPVEMIDVNQSGTEIAKARKELEDLKLIENLPAELGKYARNIRAEQVENPVELIREIDKIVEPASRTIEQYFINNPGDDFEAGSQLDQGFREIYRLEILKDVLESSLSDAQKKNLAEGKEVVAGEESKKEEKERKGGTEPEEGETEEEFKARIEKEVEGNWNRFMKEQFQMSLDEWFREDMPHKLEWSTFNDVEKWQLFAEKMQDLKHDWTQDERMTQEKMFEYKVRLNELLNQF